MYGARYRRAVRAIRFETWDGGESFDGFALDIETADGSPAAPDRNRRLLAMSERLREVAGPLYPLGAIIPSPAGLAMPHGRAGVAGLPLPRAPQDLRRVPADGLLHVPRERPASPRNAVAVQDLPDRRSGATADPRQAAGAEAGLAARPQDWFLLGAGEVTRLAPRA